mmetsp:Transcript_2557/g.4335  ORF Transcript_2557/g.4335 Transcript_2557/m.4335 type:complete len:432 (+) Transcript_2557:11-1306(+)
MWSCDVCTFAENAESVLQCTMCNTERPWPKLNDASSCQSDAALWQCQACTYAENLPSLQQCEMCHSERATGGNAKNSPSVVGWTQLLEQMGFMTHRIQAAIQNATLDFDSIVQWLVDDQAHRQQGGTKARKLNPGQQDVGLQGVGQQDQQDRGQQGRGQQDCTQQDRLQNRVHRDRAQQNRAQQHHTRQDRLQHDHAQARENAATGEQRKRPRHTEAGRTRGNAHMAAQQMAIESESAAVPKSVGPGTSSAVGSRATKRLLVELSRLQKVPGGCRAALGFEAEPVDEKNIFEWNLRLYDFATSESLGSGMQRRGIDHLAMRLDFPETYPNEPPFVYMVRPRLKEGVGFVMPGGALCMELLTPDGWSPATSIEALAMSMRAMIDAGGTLLANTAPETREHEYSRHEAQRDFTNIVKIHKERGWSSTALFRNA